MKLFMGYLRSNLRSIIMWLIIIAVFAIVFGLYNIPLFAVSYAAAISGFVGIGFFIAGFIQFRRKYRELEAMKENITLSVSALSPSADIIGKQYSELIGILHNELVRSRNEMGMKYSDMLDYYTLWIHQIKTPISAMKLILQMNDSDENRELKYELQRIEQYVEMVLCYLRLDSDSSDYVIKENDLDSIIKQAVRKFSSQFIRKKLSLVYEPVNMKVLTDEKWLLFVLEQVISNALKYTNDGSISIYVKNSTLFIADTGIGIASEDLPRIFEKGYTGCNGRIDKKASGIGLYLSKRICQKLGHTISAESSEQGTVISIDLSSERIEIE